MGPRCRTIGGKGSVIGRKGFTLLELLVVILLLAIATALVAPRLPTGSSSALQSSARSTAALFRYLGERSGSSKTVYRLHLNMSDNSIRVAQKLASGEELPPDDPMLARPVLAEGVTIADLETPRLGKVSAGEVLIEFGSNGLAEFVTLHLASAKGENFTIVGYPAGGKVKVLSGYREATL